MFLGRKLCNKCSSKLCHNLFNKYTFKAQICWRFHSTRRLEEAYKVVKTKCQCKYCRIFIFFVISFNRSSLSNINNCEDRDTKVITLTIRRVCSKIYRYEHLACKWCPECYLSNGIFSKKIAPGCKSQGCICL